MKIQFFNTLKDQYYIGEPVLASKNIPDWYKEQESYFGGKKKPIQGHNTSTVKKCMPVFDMMTAGYLIPTNCDIYIENVFDENGKKNYNIQWATGSNPVEFHPKSQFGKHPSVKEHGPISGYPKFFNPWSIKTPKGYSTLFMTPTHRESLFSILPGIVDTDRYNAPVHFPFLMNDPSFEGFIPAGTFIAQVIPIKRESWNMSFAKDHFVAELKDQENKMFRTWFDRYKNLFWEKKTYL